MAESVPRTDLEEKKRRSTRIVQAVPLTVTGVDALGRPFQERTSTLIINCHGCRYQSKHYVLKNMWVTLEVPHPETGHEPRNVRARVTWIQRPRTVRELFQVGLELEIPGNVWGIAFPPEDWFPFPDRPVLEMPSPEAEAAAEESELLLPAVGEGDIRVLTGPGGADVSLGLARQVARLVGEAKQQLQSAVREATVKAIAAETQPLLATIHSHFTEAAEKSAQAAAASYTEQAVRQALDKIDEACRAGAQKLREEWSREAEPRVQGASQQLATHLTQAAEALRAGFDQKLETHLNLTLENFKKLSAETSSSIESAKTSARRLQKESDDSADAAGQRWRMTLDGLAEEARSRLEKLEEVSRQLTDEISTATSAAQTGWRGRLEADLAAASARWNEKVETSLDRAAQQVVERLTRHSQTATKKLEQEFTLRVAALRQSFEQATGEAEIILATLRAALGAETSRVKTSLAETQQAAGLLEEQASRLNALSRATAEELERRLEALLPAAGSELDRRVESAVAGLADRLQPMLEAAGQQSVARLAAELQEQCSPQLTRANQLLRELAGGQEKFEETLLAHQERLKEAAETSVQELVARLHETISRFEKDFHEAGRAATARWLAELDEKATDSTHKSFEALYKASEWYEKKIQTQMQATLDKGLEQASTSLREKAGEISGLFASELDHYSRNYVEHTEEQMDEVLKEMVQRARGQLAQAADTTAATFGDEAHGVAEREFERFTAAVSSAFEQNAARLESHAAEVRAKMDAETRQFLQEFHQGMTQAIQQGVQQARQELETQVAQLRQVCREEREAQQRQLHESLARLGNDSLNAYKIRLENVTNSWLVATVARLSQQSEQQMESLAAAAEQRLRETCSQVFDSVGEALRQRLREFSSSLTRETTPPDSK